MRDAYAASATRSRRNAVGEIRRRFLLSFTGSGQRPEVAQLLAVSWTPRLGLFVINLAKPRRHVRRWQSGNQVVGSDLNFFIVVRAFDLAFVQRNIAARILPGRGDTQHPYRNSADVTPAASILMKVDRKRPRSGLNCSKLFQNIESELLRLIIVVGDAFR